MGVDEVDTLKGLTERRAILDRFIEEHRGRICSRFIANPFLQVTNWVRR